MTKTSNIFKSLCDLYPLKLQEKWDESGKILFFDDEVKNVLVCLDVNPESVNEAIKKHCNLIISHHPIFLKSKDFPIGMKEKELVILLNKNQISLISFHTCFDNSPIGMNYSFLSKLPIFKNIKSLTSNRGGYCTASLTNAKTTSELASFIKIKCKCAKVICLNENKSKPINKVVVCLGSGFSVLRSLLPLNNYDAYLTGDVKWHDWMYAKINNANVIDIGHDCENVFCTIISEKLKEMFDEIKVFAFPSVVKYIIK